MFRLPNIVVSCKAIGCVVFTMQRTTRFEIKEFMTACWFVKYISISIHIPIFKIMIFENDFDRTFKDHNNPFREGVIKRERESQ